MGSKNLPVITAERVVLRWVSEDDIDSLYEVFSDPQVARYWSSAFYGLLRNLWMDLPFPSC